MSLIDVVNNWLVFPLLGISEFHHAYRLSSAIETVKEFKLHLILAINALGCKVCIPIKGILSKKLNKLFNQ